MALTDRIARLERIGRQDIEGVDRIITQVIDPRTPSTISMELVAWDRTRTPREWPNLPRDEKGHPTGLVTLPQ